jgi:membrane-associated protein
MVEPFEAMQEWVTTSPLTYLLIAAAVAVDAVFPLIPGETLLISGSILASNGDLSLPLLILGGIVGAALGDNACYLLGSRLGPRIEPRLFRGERSRRLLKWAERQLAERGLLVLLVARFVPGGRTATTFSAGMLSYEWRRFVVIDGIAVTIWALYATGLGYFGGSAFEESFWRPLVVSVVVAGLITLVGEAYRRITDKATG